MMSMVGILNGITYNKAKNKSSEMALVTEIPERVHFLKIDGSEFPSQNINNTVYEIDEEIVGNTHTDETLNDCSQPDGQDGI